MMIRRGTAPGTSALKVQSGHYYHRQMLWEQGDKSTHNLLFLLLHMPQQSSESCPALCRNQKSYLVLNLRATAWLLHTSWCYLSPCKRTEITSFSSSSAPLCPQINQLQQPLLVFSNKLRFFSLNQATGRTCTTQGQRDYGLHSQAVYCCSAPMSFQRIFSQFLTT